MVCSVGLRRAAIVASVLMMFGFGVVPDSARGAFFTFYGIDEDTQLGEGSATMLFSVIESNGSWKLRVALNNTSPLLTIDNLSDNSPGIIGFGFSLTEDVSFSGWSLSAQQHDGLNFSPVDLKNYPTSDGRWELSTQLENVKLDFIPNVETDAGGGLFNPLWAANGGPPEGTDPKFYTLATLELDFLGEFGDLNTSLEDLILVSSKNNTLSPYVRMRHVGLDGEGSLKLGGDGPYDEPPGGPIPGAVPEPSSMLIWAGALAAMAVVMQRRRRFVAA